MRNPFDLDEESIDGSSEPADEPRHFANEGETQLPMRPAPTETDDGDRALLQDEDRRSDDLKERFIGTIDQGTTSTRFIIFDCTGVPIAKYQTEFRQIHQHPG